MKAYLIDSDPKTRAVTVHLSTRFNVCIHLAANDIREAIHKAMEFLNFFFQFVTTAFVTAMVRALSRTNNNNPVEQYVTASCTTFLGRQASNIQLGLLTAFNIFTGMFVFIARTRFDMTVERPWMGGEIEDGTWVYRDGLCYLIAVPDGMVRDVVQAVGHNPKAHQLATQFRRVGLSMPKMQLRSSTLAHASKYGLDTLYAHTRVGSRAKRNRRLSLEIKAGVPAATCLGDGRYTSNLEVTQPLGKWTVEGSEIWHEGPYLPSWHNPNDYGYCYLHLFAPRYRATVEAWLGRCPRAKEVRKRFFDYPRFVDTDAQLRLDMDATGTMILAHLSLEAGAKAPCEVIDLLPIHKTFLGARSERSNTIESAQTRSERAVRGLHPVLVQEITRGVVASTCLHDQCFTSDYQMIQPQGTWEFAMHGYAIHRGSYRPAYHAPNSDGYCYLNLFAPRYRAVAEARLGRHPYYTEIVALTTAQPHWLISGSRLGITVDRDETRTWAPVLTHVFPDAWRQKRSASDCIGLLDGNVGTFVVGMPGEDPDHDSYEDGAETTVNEFTVRAPFALGHHGPLSSDYRDPASTQLHGMCNEVIAAAGGHFEDSPYVSSQVRRNEIFDIADSAFAMIIARYGSGQSVLVTGANWARCEMTAKHPGDTVDGAERGIVFASQAGDGPVHPAWDVILLPLRKNEGRLLANIRVLVCFGGRADLDFLIVNATKSLPARRAFRLAKWLAIAHGTLLWDWSPAWCGCYFTQGAIWFNDYEVFRNAFARYGHVYGLDEAMIAERSPIVVPDPNFGKPFYGIRADQTFADITYIDISDVSETDSKGIGRAFTADRWDLRRMMLAYRGQWPSYLDVTTVPRPHYRSIRGAIAQARLECAQGGIRMQGDVSESRVARRGGRYSHTTYLRERRLMDDQLAAGTIWRPYDIAFGLRSRLNLTTTQGLSPEVWDEIAHPTLVGDPVVRSALVNARCEIAMWARDLPSGTTIAVASVGSQAMMNEFRSFRKEFTRWVWFTEDATVVCPEGDVVCVLPLTMGTGFIFQLARLIPATVGRHDTFMTCVNDLETDWIPRNERLAAGMACMPVEPIVFPAMGANAPCPFQDVVARMDALTTRWPSLLQTLTTLGWIYGVDEVWACHHELPTLAVTWKAGAAATHNFANPKSNRLLRVVGDELHEWRAPNGNFHSIFLSNAAPCKKHSLSLSGADFAGLDLAVLPPECNGLEWRDRYSRLAAQAMRRGANVVAIFVWGTRGDRVPLEFIARQLRLRGTQVVVVSLCTVEEGRQGLALCETRQGHQLLPGLFHARMITGVCHVPSLVPWFIGGNEACLRYSLAPGSKDSRASAGGLYSFFDHFVPIVSGLARVDIRIGAYRGGTWFPRSADGVNALVKAPPRAKTGRKGYVMGSSSIAVPEKYRLWEQITDTNHAIAFQAYDEIACAGGAGVVQTIAMAGAKAIAWDDSIDRRYRTPGDAGANVDGNEATESSMDALDWWVKPHKPWFPPLRAWRKVFHLWVSIHKPFQMSWSVLFFVYSHRYRFVVMPTLNSSIWQIITPFKTVGVNIAMYALATAMWHVWGRIDPRPVYMRVYAIARVVLRGATSGWLIFLAMIGFHTRTSFYLACLVTAMPPLADLAANIRFGVLRQMQSQGVHIGFTPVFFCGWIPIGIHSTLYDATNGRIIEGRHVGRDALGGQFRRIVTHRHSRFAWVWYRTNLTTDDLPTRPSETGAYSALFNCQTITAQLVMSAENHQGPLLTVLMVLLVMHAWLCLAVASLVAFIGASVSTTVVLALLPESDFGAALKDTLDTVVETVTRMSPQFAAPDGGEEGMEDWEDPEAEADETLENIREIAAQFLQAAISDGVPGDTAAEAMANALPMWLEESGSSESFSTWEERRPAASGLAASIKQNVGAAIRTAVTELHAAGVPSGWVESSVKLISISLTSTSNLATWATIGLARLCDLTEERYGGPAVRQVREIITAVLADVPGPGRRKKNAWAPLFRRPFDSIRLVDWMTTGTQEFQLQQADNPMQTIIQNMNDFTPDGQDPVDLQQKFVRKMALPRAPRVSPGELKYPGLLHTVGHSIDPTLTLRAEKYESMGGKQGIDGVWLATDENRYAVNARYLAEGRPWTEAELLLAEKTADALFEAHKDAFDKPGIVRPETVARQLVRKYSPSIPLMCRHKRRDELFRNGWMDAIIQATYRRLEEGRYPPQAYHEFAKMQVVTKLRTVIAQDLASYFVDQVVQLERNKRSFWKQADMGMGAPIRTGYLAEVFERVDARQTAFSADVTAYDANTPPVIFRALLRLGELGVKSGGIPKVAEVLRSKYIAMQNAIIVDLPSGNVLRKRRGGGTGQSATSWDNHWGMRIAMIMIWSVVTGKEPSEFYLTNTVHNTGDDNIWGTDDDLDPDEVSRVAQEWLGLDLRVEGRGSIPDLTYLGRIPKVSTDVPEVGRFPLPKFVAAPLREQFLLRRSAVVSRFSGLPDRQYHEKMVERGIGHLNNCAFDQELFSLVLREYMEDASAFLDLPNGLLWRTKNSKNGLLEGVTPRIQKGTRLTRRQQAAYEKLKTTLCAPTYQGVLGKDLAPAGKEADESKFAYASVPLGWEKIVRNGLADIRTFWHLALPNELVRLASKDDAAPVAPLFWVPGYPLEKFVYKSMLLDGDTISYDAFTSRLRRAPFSPASDPAGFWWYLDHPGMRDAVIAEDMRVCRGRMIIATVVYLAVNKGLSMLQSISLIGIPIDIFFFVTQDLNRLFSVLSTFYWIDTGDSSPAISALAPPDPYAVQKIASVCSTVLVPNWMAMGAGALWVPGGAMIVSDMIARAFAARAQATELAQHVANNVNPWMGDVVKGIITQIKLCGPRGIFISAPTATGKSTGFPAAILAAEPRCNVWLLTPRVLLRETYKNPWLHTTEVNKLQRNSVITDARLKISTYGHFNARLKSGSIVGEHDFVLLDEFHEADPEMGLACFNLRKHCRKAYLSATYSALFAPEADVYQVGIPRPFSEPIPTRLGLDAVGLFNEAVRDHPTEVGRTLVICPGRQECSRVQVAISQLGYPATVVSSDQRSFPPRGVIVATQVVDSGVDIDPPVNVVIDTGRRVASHRGRTHVWPTDYLTDKQRRGRAGRRGEGWVYTSLDAGSGDTPVTYPTYCRMIGEEAGRTWLFERLGILDDLEIVERPSAIDRRMALMVNTQDPLVIRSLYAYWLLACTPDSDRAIAAKYDNVVRNGWPETLEGQARILERFTRETQILPRSMIAQHLATVPFAIRQGGVVRRTNGLSILDGRIIAR
uniref:Uncharacterized protein n=1 Tax=Mycosphaerella hypovirus A TaxID=2592776 RepID=A0A7G3W8S2_9VIRU|nr:unknown [Mycosphaerella hypovirus A]